MQNVFGAHANANRKECNPGCLMQGIGDKEQYYKENIEKLYTHKMPHAFTGSVDPDSTNWCTNRFEADGSQSTATFSQYVQMHSNLASFNRARLITPSTSSTPSTIHTRKSKNVSLPSTTSATKNAPTNVTNVSAQHFGTSNHGRVTLQELPGYVAKMLGFENKNVLRAIKVPVGDNINVQCLYNDCGENIVRGSLREEDKIATMLPTPGDFAEQVMFEEGIDDPREEDPSVAAMLQANMSGYLGEPIVDFEVNETNRKLSLDLENIELIEDDEALMEAIEEIFGQLPIELRDDDKSTVLCFSNECDSNYQCSENEEVKNQTPPTVEDFTDEVIFVEEIDDPREEDPVVSGMLRTNTPASFENYVGDSNRTLSAENQENIPEPVDHNAQPMKTLPVLDNRDLFALANCVCFEDGGTETQASKDIHSLRSIELRDGYNSYVQSFDKDCEENIISQCFKADEDITNPRPALEDFKDEVIFVEEIGDAREEDPVVSGMLQKNTLANFGALIEDCDMDSNEKAEHNVQPMETPYTPVPKNSSNLRDSLELDNCVRFADGGTGAQTSEDIHILRSIELRDDYNSYVQSFVKDCGANIICECLKAGEDMTISPPTLEHFADEVMFVEEIDDPREEAPVVSGMLQNNTLGSIVDEDNKADSNRTPSAENQKHVLQLVGHYAQPIISPCVPVPKNSCNSDGTSHRSMDSENFVILKKDGIRTLNIEDIYNLDTPDLRENGEIYIQSFYKDCGENIIRKILKDEEDITNLAPPLEDFTDEVIFIEEVDDPREEDPVVSGMLRTNTPESIDELIEDHRGSHSNPKHLGVNQDNRLQPLEHNITFLGMPLKISSVPVLPNSGKSNGTSRRKQSLKPILKMNVGNNREPLKQIENQATPEQFCVSNSANRGRKGRVSKRHLQNRTVPYRKYISM